MAVTELVDVDVASLRERLKTVESDNVKARANAKRAETLKEYNRHSEHASELDRQIEGIDKAMQTKMTSAKFPVDGMSLDSEGVLLNGLPYEQASKAERIMAAVDVGIAMNPKLRLFVCQDGNDLDDETIEALDAKLEQHDFQMLVELATRSAGDEELCAVIIKNGEVAKTNPKPEKSPL